MTVSGLANSRFTATSRLFSHLARAGNFSNICRRSSPTEVPASESGQSISSAPIASRSTEKKRIRQEDWLLGFTDEFGLEGTDEGEIAVVAVVVETVADDEFVLNFKPDVIRRHLGRPFLLFA